MTTETTRVGMLPRTVLVALAALAVAAPVLAEDAEVTLVTIKASGAPTGAAEIDAELKDLPGIDKLCLRFAKCAHEATVRKRVSWETTHSLGEESSRIEFTLGRPVELEGKQVMKLELVAYKGGEPCSRSAAVVSARSAASVACDDRDSAVQLLHLVMARPL